MDENVCSTYFFPGITHTFLIASGRKTLSCNETKMHAVCEQFERIYVRVGDFTDRQHPDIVGTNGVCNRQTFPQSHKLRTQPQFKSVYCQNQNIPGWKLLLGKWTEWIISCKLQKSTQMSSNQEGWKFYCPSIRNIKNAIIMLICTVAYETVCVDRALFPVKTFRDCHKYIRNEHKNRDQVPLQSADSQLLIRIERIQLNGWRINKMGIKGP